MFSQATNRARYWTGFALLCLVQVIIAWSAVTYIHESRLADIREKSRKDSDFLYHVIQEKLQEKNYTSVATLIRTWGEQQKEYLSKISLTMANGFLLGEYRSQNGSVHLETLNTTIPYSYQGSARLEMTIDTGTAYTQSWRLGWFFGANILLFSLLLALMIRLYLRKMILTAEVNERSETLAQSVKELQGEIDAREKAESALVISEEKYRTMMNNQNDAIFLYRLNDEENLVFSEVNQRAVERYGYSREEFLALPPAMLSTAEELSMLREFACGEQNPERQYVALETRHVKCSGELLPVEIQAAFIAWKGEKYVLSTARDISERIAMQERQEQLERQMLHAQKLESLGVLAGGIAHDFNNILMVILGHGDLAEMKLSKEAPAAEHLEQIKQAARKAADLANQMLAYSGKGKFLVEPLDLSLLIREMEYMLSVSISKKAVLRYDLNDHLPSVLADATQLRQIILNLVINASDAIGDKSGIIAVSTGFMDCDSQYLSETWLDESLPEGVYVYIEVADTGCGMDRELISKIFDPFFTTKFAGRGLGMSSVLGIVRGHKGAIKVYSELGKGTTMKVLFPASEMPAVLFDALDVPEELELSGTVLLVDDEEAMRSLGKSMLEILGFSVLVAGDGREAVKIYREHRAEILFVLMDVTMPHMDGEEAYREMRRIDPEVRAIMSSGYNEQDIMQKFVGKGMAGFLQKPYQLSALQNAIQKLNLSAEPSE